VSSSFGRNIPRGSDFVNLDKTMCNRRFVEINSQVYDANRLRLIPKPSFGFLRGTERGVTGEGEEWVDDPWDALFRTVTSGIKHFAVKAFILTHYLVRRVLEKCGPPNLLSIPRRFHKVLFKKRWFRSLAISKQAETEKPPTYRELEYTYGPVVDDETDAEVVLAEKAAISEYKRKWDGVPYRPERPRKETTTLAPAPIRISRGPVVVRRLWVKSVFERMQYDLKPYDWVSDGWTPYTIKRDHPEYSLHRGCVISRNDRKDFAPYLGTDWVGVRDEEKLVYRHVG